jgi:hypothetical protein
LKTISVQDAIPISEDKVGHDRRIKEAMIGG